MTKSAAREIDDGMSAAVRKARPDPRTSSLLLLTPALRVSDTAVVAPGKADRPRSWTLEAQIAELEAAVGEIGDWEPDGSEDRPRHFRVRRPGENASRGLAPHIDPRPQPSPRSRAPLGEMPSLYDENDLVLAGIDITADRLPDPDELRDLVAEIVRSELMGELGQRVTRNIRKLVRREIRRALAARDFD